jgi:thioredoxin-dependent peroxiredoxin
MTIRIGSAAPDFVQDSTRGRIRLHAYLDGAWGLLFSHPRDFTPVCTTELGRAARLEPEFDRRNVRLLAVSVDDVASHQAWLQDIALTQGGIVSFPILADADRKVSSLYDMIHPEASETFTVRSVFFIDPKKIVRAIVTYPASTGRNFDELLRVVDSLQLTDNYKVATPADWRDGEEVVILPSIQDPVELRERFPQGYIELTSYLRLTPQPNREPHPKHKQTPAT